MTMHLAERPTRATPSSPSGAAPADSVGGAQPDPAPLSCACGCGFPITAGMSVRLIHGRPYVLGCISEPVLIDENGKAQMDAFGAPAGLLHL